MPPNKRFLNFSLEHLKTSRQGVWFVVDMVMLLLITVNLALIIVDSIYRTEVGSEFVQNMVPFLAPALDALRSNFYVIDLWFVSIFLTEFSVRWYVEVKHSTYDRWYFYPFIHWYDLIGCIPLTGTRMLRFLRVFSIIYRLQQYQIIDIRDTAPVRFFAFYYDVLLEELSDRVVVKVISSIQGDLKSDSKLTSSALEQLIQPRLKRLMASSEIVTANIAMAMKSDVDHPFSVKLRTSVVEAMAGNEDLKRLGAIPIIGDQLSGRLEETVAEITVETIACLIDELPELLKSESLQKSLRTGEAGWGELDTEIIDLLDDVLEFAKDHVGRKGWKSRLNNIDQQNSMGKQR